MDIKETGKKLKPFAPVLSVALVTACVAGSLSGYEAPVYAATQEETPVKKEETKEKKEEKKTAAKGSFNLEDGVYKGTGTGYAGDITVSVLIKDKQIVSIDILSSSDDAAFFTRAKAVIDKIIEGQTLDVDTVSGATFSSRGIISAVKNALTGEKDTSETGQAQSGQTGAAAGSSTSVAQVEDAAAYKDGTYYGSGTGFGGPLKVMVEISGGKIASIQIVENSDGSDYISKAASLIDSIITTQSTNVDTVSGATYSSVGIIQAVRDALGQAVVNGTSDSTQNSNNNSNNNSSSDDDSSTVTGTVPYKEGIYYGTAEGYSGDVSVAVVIQEKTIKAILITESSDDEAFFNRAMDVVKKVIRTQKTDDADGNLVFSEVKGQEATKVEGVTAELLTETSYGDYELDLDGLPEEIKSDNVNAVVVKTTDGTAYGMRHLENIWRGNEIAWSTGFTSEVHGCPTSSEHYKSMMGKTIDSIEYYTTNGVYTMDIADIYVPVKSETTKSEVADADIAAGKTTINVQLPDGFDPEYSVDGLDVSVEGNVLTFKAATESRAAASVKPGKYTLTIKDKNKKYADVVTTFTLTTKDMPAAYDEENKKLVEAEGFDIDALKAYLGNITSVNVNGKDYAASGRGSVVIINKDGTIKTDADPFKDAVAGTEFQITVASTGYTTPLTFTYKIAETPAPAEVDTTALEAAIAEADNLKEADYTADSWAAYQAALQNARTVLEAKESQEAVNQALSTLNAAKDALVKAEEEPVAINTASLEKAIADAKALKEADYTAESWKALQSALSDARKALEAKESQEAVDNATNSLNKAIKALVKKGSSSVKKTDGTTNGSKTSGSDSVKTGDPASVLGWLGLAVSSLGAGMGGFAWKRRKRK